MNRALAWAGMAAIVLLALTGLLDLGRGWRIVFVAAQAPVLGAVLLLAIGRLVGADWSAFAPLAGLAWWLVPLAVVLGISGAGVVVPEHLGWWQGWPAVAVRGGLFTAALAWAGGRLAAGASTSFAAGTLALYAAVVSIVGFDWLGGADPGHSVSLSGMLLAVLEIGAACAVLLARGAGAGPLRRDMAKLLAAAMLGLSYLVFVDYLVTWYGNLPGRVGYYVVRIRPGLALLPFAALLVGLGGTIAALAAGRLRTAGGAALAGIALLLLWWIGGGSPMFGLTALVAIVGFLALSLVGRGVAGAAHG